MQVLHRRGRQATSKRRAGQVDQIDDDPLLRFQTRVDFQRLGVGRSGLRESPEQQVHPAEIGQRLAFAKRVAVLPMQGERALVRTA